MEEDSRWQHFSASRWEVHASWCLEMLVLYGVSGAKLTPKHTGYNDQMPLPGGEAALCFLHAERSLSEPVIGRVLTGSGQGELEPASGTFSYLDSAHLQYCTCRRAGNLENVFLQLLSTLFFSMAQAMFVFGLGSVPSAPVP